MSTVWQACENATTARDGQAFRFMGRYATASCPALFELVQAIKPL